MAVSRSLRSASPALMALLLSACVTELTMPTPLSQSGPKEQMQEAAVIAEATTPALPQAVTPQATPTVTITPTPAQQAPDLLQGVATFVFSLPGFGSGPVPTSTAPAATLVSPGIASGGSGPYQLFSVAFMAGENISGQPLTWRRCSDDQHYANPSAFCPQAASASSIGTKSGSLQIEGGGAYLAPEGVVTLYYLLIDSTGAAWASPSLDGRDLLPWCGAATLLGREAFLAVYDFSADPAYNFFEDNVIEYFVSSGRAESAPLECP